MTRLTILAVFLLAGPTRAQAQPAGEYAWHPMMSGGGWFMGPLMMMLFFVFVIVAVVIVLRLLGVLPGRHQSDSSMEILRQRFARGEIDREEFEERRKLLS